MEIPEINMISGFEAGMKCLQNPSSISRLFFPFLSFWKWGALIFAFFATFSSIIRRIKLIFINLRTVKPSLPIIEEIIEFDEDDGVSLASSSDDDDEPQQEEDDDDDEEEDDESSIPTTSFRSHEAFRVRGTLRSRLSWSEFTTGKHVVKLWDSLGLSLDFDEDLINYDPNGIVSLWGQDEKNNKDGCPVGWVWDIPLVLTAEKSGKGDGVIVCGYDRRVRPRAPALYADWKSPVDGVVTVGDVRNTRVPLESVGESDGETWWDADAVILEDDY